MDKENLKVRINFGSEDRAKYVSHAYAERSSWIDLCTHHEALATPSDAPSTQVTLVIFGDREDLVRLRSSYGKGMLIYGCRPYAVEILD